MSSRKPTMKDVAAQAGVSAMAVSYALRGHPSIPKKTTERIRAIAAQLGYKPHPLVSILIKEIRAGRKVMAPPVIGYITSFAGRSYSGRANDYYSGVKARCEELGFAFAHYEMTKYGMSGKRLSKAMKYANVCGIVIAPVPTPGMSLDLDWDAFSSVAFGYTMGSPPIHRIVVNHWQSIRLVLQKLTEKGYTRIANGTTPRISKWIDGTYEAGVDAYHRKIPPSRRIPILTNTPRSPEIMKAWLEKYRPDAFVSHLGSVYESLIEKAGWRIPEDIACATLGWPIARAGLAGLNQNVFQTAKAAVDVLVQQIQDNRRGIPELPSFTMVNGSWVDGPSAPDKRKAVAKPTIK